MHKVVGGSGQQRTSVSRGSESPGRRYPLSSAATASVMVIGADAPDVDAEAASYASMTPATTVAVWRTDSLAGDRGA